MALTFNSTLVSYGLELERATHSVQAVALDTGYRQQDDAPDNWCQLELEAQRGFEPMNSGFADRRVSHFATAPIRAGPIDMLSPDRRTTWNCCP